MVHPLRKTESRSDLFDEAGVRAAIDRFYAALDQVFSGDLKPMEEIWSRSREVTHMGPFGLRQQGWGEILSHFDQISHMKLSGRIRPVDVLVRVGDGFAVVTCLETSEGMSEAGSPIQVRIRATSVLRYEEGEWKMLHHHTDLAHEFSGHPHADDTSSKERGAQAESSTWAGQVGEPEL